MNIDQTAPSHNHSVKTLSGSARAVLTLIAVAMNTIFWSTLLLLVALMKLFIPLRSWRRFCSRILNRIAGNWIAVNNRGMDLLGNIEWDVRIADQLDPKAWYLVVSNHQSWVDILVLQKIFHRKIPLLKFFLKKQLMWVPFLGLAWWALDFPFMKRHSHRQLERNPRLRGKDLVTTRQACEKFKILPVSVMNFVEGSRFTVEKHLKQGSPYKNLLKPKAGGLANVLTSMHDHLNGILDVTIVYPGGTKNLWQFLSGSLNKIRIRVEMLPIQKELLGDYFQDEAYRRFIQNWLNRLWSEKDQRIESLLQSQS